MFSGFIATDFTDFYSNQPHLLSGGPGEMAKGPDVLRDLMCRVRVQTVVTV